MAELSTDLQLIEAARLLDANKAEEIKMLDLTGIHGYLDYFVIASALSRVHLKKLSEDLLGHFKKVGLGAQRPTENDLQSGWVILDFKDFVIHLFTAERREFYNLENLWKDAQQIDWQ